MIEKAPKSISSLDVISLLLNDNSKEAIAKVNIDYLYWDKAKYFVPEHVKPEAFWSAVKLSRSLMKKNLEFPCCSVSYCETPFIQELLHDFDRRFEELLLSENSITDRNKRYHMINSIMEEAIASSQMEGASTTRKIAIEMLRKQQKPKDHSQQMILNNFNTIMHLSEKKNEPLSIQLILDVHKHITEKTLDNAGFEGRFRTDDGIVVRNSITGEIVHVPPAWTLIEPSVNKLCSFINEEKEFVHPIVKAMILHFMISYLHPFVDGNGRTARSLFYWYLLKKGYWLTEFMSFSKIIYKSKAQYEKSFLYAENDGLDLTYFIIYNLDVMKKAFIELQKYLKRKTSEENALLEFRIPGMNERQSRIIKIFTEKSDAVIESKELERVLNASVKTIRSDLEGLVELGLLERIPKNKRLVGYARSRSFEERLREIRGN